MFARFKGTAGQIIAIVPYKVQALIENTGAEGVKTTTIITDFNGDFEVQGPERATRSALVKASGPVPVGAEALTEAEPAGEQG